MKNNISKPGTVDKIDDEQQITGGQTIGSNVQDTPMPSFTGQTSVNGSTNNMMTRAAEGMIQRVDNKLEVVKTGSVPLSSPTITSARVVRPPAGRSKTRPRKRSASNIIGESEEFNTSSLFASGQSHPPLWKECLRELRCGLRGKGILLSDFQIVENRGEGGEASVFKAYPLRRDGPFAQLPSFVILRKSRTSNQEKKSHQRTATNIHDLVKEHPNIVHSYGTFESRHHIYQILEPLFGGSIDQILLDCDSPQMRGNELLALHIMKQVFSALGHMHERGFAHGDVAPDNIMVEEPNWDLKDNLPTAKLIDFGFATEWNTKYPESAQSTYRVCKIGYTPAEVFFARSFSRPCADVYSAGVTFYFIITGKLPYHLDYSPNKTDENMILMKYETVLFDEQIWYSISPATRSIIEDCLKHDPASRPSAIVAEYRVKEAIVRTQSWGGRPSSVDMSSEVEETRRRS